MKHPGLSPNYDLDKIKFATDAATFQKAGRLSKEEKQLTTIPTSSGRIGILNKAEVKEIKASITAAMRYIKPYDGPSRIWFTYQNSLFEGCNRLAKIVSGLPVCERTAELLLDMLLKLDDKLSRGGVDDSDGTVGGFIEEVVSVLKEYARLTLPAWLCFTNSKIRKPALGGKNLFWNLLTAKLIHDSISSAFHTENRGECFFDRRARVR